MRFTNAYASAPVRTPTRPTSVSTSISHAGHASGGPASYYSLRHLTVAGRQGKEPRSSKCVWDILGLEKYHGSDIDLTEDLAIEASKTIIDAVHDGKQFYVNFAPYAVHSPLKLKSGARRPAARSAAERRELRTARKGIRRRNQYESSKSDPSSFCRFSSMSRRYLFSRRVASRSNTRYLTLRRR